MINWTKEDVKFICDTMINPAMVKLLKFIETSNDSQNRITDSIVNTLGKTSYQQAREIAFLKFIVIQHCHLDPDKFNLVREEYFKQFDALNKDNKEKYYE